MRRSLRAKHPWTGEPRTVLSTEKTGAEATLLLSSSPGDWQGIAGGGAGRWDGTPLRDAPYHTSQKQCPVVIPPVGTRRLDRNVGQRQPVLWVWCCRCFADHTPECHPLHRRQQGAWRGQSEECALLA
jgi:hypothetical protein